MLRFRHIPAAGRVIIVVVAVGVSVIALVACATSYNAIYRLVGMLDLYGYRTNQAFPLLLDAAFLVAELAAILGSIMRTVTRSDEVSPGWPGLTMVLCGLGTIAFNVAHAYLIGGGHDPLTWWRCAVASLPPVLMILSFQVLIAIVKWVMLHLGRPEQAFGGAGSAGMLFGTPQAQMPRWNASEASEATGQFGHGWGSGGEAPTKGSQVDAYLDAIGPEGASELKARGITRALQNRGVDVSERYVKQRLDARTGAAPGRNGHGEP